MSEFDYLGECSDPPEESCSDAGCPAHGHDERDDAEVFGDDHQDGDLRQRGDTPVASDQNPDAGAVLDAASLRGRHPGVQQIARFFEYGHLPEALRPVSGDCAWLAAQMITVLPDGPELTAGLRKLLEAKDCFVRAALPQ